MSNGTPNERQEELKQELEEADQQAGGGPETDRDKKRREQFIELYTNDPPSGSAGSTEPTTGTTSG